MQYKKNKKPKTTLQANEAKSYQLKTNSGFALLFAVLIASIVLALGAEIFNIALKEIILSSAARDSQFAFYASDTGAECALYWDLKGEPGGNPPSVFMRSPSIGSGVTCNGVDVAARPWSVVTNVPISTTTTFVVDFQAQGRPYCAQVIVKKEETQPGLKKTVIESRGYNTGYDAAVKNCTGANPRKAERGIRVTY